MKITDRIAKLMPNDVKVYWNGNINQLSVHSENKYLTKTQIENIVLRELDFANLLRAVESLRIIIY